MVFGNKIWHPNTSEIKRNIQLFFFLNYFFSTFWENWNCNYLVGSTHYSFNNFLKRVEQSEKSLQNQKNRKCRNQKKSKEINKKIGNVEKTGKPKKRQKKTNCNYLTFIKIQICIIHEDKCRNIIILRSRWLATCHKKWMQCLYKFLKILMQLKQAPWKWHKYYEHNR